MLVSFGHGSAPAERMIGLLRDAGVSVLIDVRTAPGSRRHPHVARAELQRWLPEAGHQLPLGQAARWFAHPGAGRRRTWHSP